MELSAEQVQALKALIEDLRHDLDNVELDNDKRAILEQRIVELEAQVEAKDADETLIGECCSQIEGLFEDLAARAVNSGILQKISALFGV